MKVGIGVGDMVGAAVSALDTDSGGSSVEVIGSVTSGSTEDFSATTVTSGATKLFWSLGLATVTITGGGKTVSPDSVGSMSDVVFFAAAISSVVDPLPQAARDSDSRKNTIKPRPACLTNRLRIVRALKEFEIRTKTLPARRR